MAAKAKNAKKPVIRKGKGAPKAAAKTPPADVKPTNPPATTTEAAPITLSGMEDAFVREYLIDLNATQAAIRAGYSRKTARQQGYRLLTKVHIQTALKAALDARRERVGVSADAILAEFRTIGFSDVGELFRQPVDKEGKPTGRMQIKPLADWSMELRRAISTVKIKHYPERSDKDGNVFQEEHDIIEIKFWDKQTALRAMGEHIDLFKGKDPEDPNKKPTHVFIVAGQRVEF